MDVFTLKDKEYKSDQALVKVYGTGENKKIKVVRLTYLKTKGLESNKKTVSIYAEHDAEAEIDTEITEDTTKLAESISRAKSKIFELAFCNEWDYFFTGTLDPAKYKRDDLETFHKDLTKWIGNQGVKRGEKIEYLLVPELHSDGQTWHLHGFVKGVSPLDLNQYTLGMKMSKSIAAKLRDGDTVYSWTPYENKFGYCTVEVIRNTEAISKYIQKYMSKELGVDVSRSGAHLYYRSRGLQSAEYVCSGDAEHILPTLPMVASYASDHCKVYWLDYSPELLNELRLKLT